MYNEMRIDLSTLADAVCGKSGAACSRILHPFPGFYVGADAAHAPVLPKLCGGMVFPQAAVRYNKDVPERQKTVPEAGPPHLIG
ncbi:MAG: hypothetical protein ACLUFD_03410 [Faecalibacterium sp.]